MRSFDHQKQAQEYHSNSPLIILGSGASAAHGLSGMAALAKHLVEHTDTSGLTNTEIASWGKFCQALNTGTDLETALHQVPVTEQLTTRIIRSTWTLINSEDSQVFKSSLHEENMFPLSDLLKHIFASTVTTVNIVTTNYDRLAEYACDQAKIHHYTGFTAGFLRQLAEPNEIKCARKVNIWKVHGSIDWFNCPSSRIIGLSDIETIPENYTPQIVTPGIQKYQSTHLEPYRSIISNADNAITNAKSYLCIGYGFNDEHLQPKLITKCRHNLTPITIITYALSDAARRLITGNEKPQHFLAIERGVTDDESIIHSSYSAKPFTVKENIWSLKGYLSLIK